MARSTKSTSTPATAIQFTPEQLRVGVQRLQRTIEAVEVFDPQAMAQRGAPEVSALEKRIEDALEKTFGADTARYRRFRDAADFDQGPRSMYVTGHPRPPVNHRAFLEEGKTRALLLLREALRGLEEEFEEHGATAPEAASAGPRLVRSENRRIFVVHGREDGPREAVARFLERLGFEPIILHEQANQGRTVIEKVEHHSKVDFAVVILTPDDEGALKGEPIQPRARQNVLLELGYFLGKLTRKRVCTLKVGELEIPSDWRGVVDEPFDTAGAWRQTLARELDAAGYEVDWNKVMRT